MKQIAAALVMLALAAGCAKQAGGQRPLLCDVMLALVAGCARQDQRPAAGSFGDDVEFLQPRGGALVLSDATGMARVAVSPLLQGRVMTSTSDGPAGMSYGWINRDLIASGVKRQHFNPYGGEDRFWMGPEGGQFSIFFSKDEPFDLDHWYTPPSLDIRPWNLVSKSRGEAKFRSEMQLKNYSGTKFDVTVDRTVRVLEPAEVWKHLNVAPATPAVRMVAFESVNRITNAGKDPWKKESGLLSIWILGMFKPSPTLTVVAPFSPGAESELGPVVNADYFGRVPPERLVVRGSIAFFSADGKFRSKIGLSPKRARPVLGSYDATNVVLTIVQFTMPATLADYVNSMWEIQKNPYAGDVANSYNDGPPKEGVKPMGPFYELESSSPAAALEPGKSMEHVHRTIHLRGPEAELDRIAREVLGAGLKEIATALPR
jgi:hypothetical protein